MFNIIKKALIAVVILFCANIIWTKHSDNRNYKSWPTASARLISAKVVIGSAGRTNQPGWSYFTLETKYEFTVDGRIYYSDANKIGVPRFATEKEALSYLNDLTSRSVHTVHYHPRTPEKNALSY
jgi:hypothetical protein